MLLSLIFGLIIGAISVIFALQNIFPVTVTFMVWQLSTSLAVIIIFAILIGLTIGVIISIPETVKSIFTISKLKRENKKLSDEHELIHNTSQSELEKNQTEQSIL
jgi:uncharacterized integral membrane protein